MNLKFVIGVLTKGKTMNKPFDIISLYNNLDDKKDKLKKLRFNYNKLMHIYKNLLIENVNLRTQVENNKHKG